jgi:hypothetical protein
MAGDKYFPPDRNVGCMLTLNEHASSVYEGRLLPFVVEDLNELIEKYERFEAAQIEAVTELCASYLAERADRVAGNVVIFDDKPYHWSVIYSPSERHLTILVAPEYNTRARQRDFQLKVYGIGRIAVVSLLYIEPVAKKFIPLVEACAELVLKAHRLLESSFSSAIAKSRRKLLQGIDEIIRVASDQSHVSLNDLTFAFSVTTIDKGLFSYALSAENVASAIIRCNAKQISGASPFELIAALLTTEMQDAVLANSSGDVSPVTVVPYLSLQSMETNYDFWKGEHIFLGGDALAAIDVGTYKGFMLQLNVGVQAQEIGSRLVRDSRALLLARFKANVDDETKIFGRARRFSAKLVKGAGREATVEFLSDLFWKIVQKSASGGT